MRFKNKLALSIGLVMFGVCLCLPAESFDLGSLFGNPQPPYSNYYGQVGNRGGNNYTQSVALNNFQIRQTQLRSQINSAVSSGQLAPSEANNLTVQLDQIAAMSNSNLNAVQIQQIVNAFTQVTTQLNADLANASAQYNYSQAQYPYGYGSGYVPVTPPSTGFWNHPAIYRNGFTNNRINDRDGRAAFWNVREDNQDRRAGFGNIRQDNRSMHAGVGNIPVANRDNHAGLVNRAGVPNSATVDHNNRVDERGNPNHPRH